MLKEKLSSRDDSFSFITLTGFNIPDGFFLHYTSPSTTFKVYGIDILNIAINLLIVIGAVGVWYWKQWGYYLLLGIYVFQFILDAIIVQLPNIINHHSYNVSGLLGLALLYVIFHQDLKYLKQRGLPPETEERVNDAQ